MISKLTFGLFKKTDTQSFLRLMVYIKPYKMRLMAALLAIFGVALTESYLAAFIAPLINQGFEPPKHTPPMLLENHFFAQLVYLKQHFNYLIWGTPNKVFIVPLFFMTLVVFRGICRFVSTYLTSWVALMAIGNLRQDMFDKMLLLSSEYYQKTSSGDILMQVVQMTDSAINNASNVFIVLIRDTLIVLGLTFVLFYLNWQLALIVMVMFPVLSLLSRYYRTRLKDIISGAQLSVGTLNTVVNETHLGHRIIKLFQGEQNAKQRFGAVNDTIVRLGKKINQAAAARSPMSEVIGSSALGIVIFVALWQSQQGTTTIGEFMAFIVAMMQMFGPIKNLANISIPMQTMFLASDSVCLFLDTPPETNQGIQAPAQVLGDLCFDKVSVKYREDGKKALDDFTLTIKAGEKIALVGRSGSGKTTAIHLLARFVSPNEGRVLLGDTDIRNLELDAWRRQLALVSQDTFLFDDTLYNNIKYGRPNASEEDIIAAAKAANLQAVVENSTLGLHQPIGANGSLLSGGQRQRVSIARAILKNAPILLLDEATSALDNESERLVQQALTRLMQGKTSIIIAHRLSTVEKADRIVVMDEGKILEQGAHHELLKKSGHYANLYHNNTLPL